MNNEILDNSDLLTGLNMNPIPLEFSQTMTTTKWLLSMQAKLTAMSTAVNGWYDKLYTDINNEGILYQQIEQHLDSTFMQQLNNLNTLLNTLAIKPISILTTAPTKLIYQVGETINNIVLTFNAIKGSNNFVKAEIYKNGTLLTTINTIINGSNVFTDSNIISFDTEYYVKIFDTLNNSISNIIKYQFTNTIFTGVIANNTTITNAVVTSLPSIQMLKGNMKSSFTPINQKIIIAYPASFGLLNSIIDDNNFQLLTSFVPSTLTVTIGVNIPILYNVYINDSVLNGNINLTFNL